MTRLKIHSTGKRVSKALFDTGQGLTVHILSMERRRKSDVSSSAKIWTQFE